MNRELVAKAAVAQHLLSKAKGVLDSCKEELDSDMAPGDRSYATIDGAEVGTVSKTKPRSTEKWVVTDSRALLEWARDNGHEDAIDTTPRLAEWFTGEANLKALTQDGDVPDGVSLVESTGKSYIRVGVSAKQAEALDALIASRQIAGLLDA